MAELDDLRAEVRRLRDAIDRAANVLYRGFGASKAELARIAAEVRRILRAEVPAKKGDEPPK